MPVIEIVSQCRIHIRQGYVVITGDFVGTLAQTLVPDDDILHGDPMTSNAGFAT